MNIKQRTSELLRTFWTCRLTAAVESPRLPNR